jgi:hypothetical protein
MLIFFIDLTYSKIKTNYNLNRVAWTGYESSKSTAICENQEKKKSLHVCRRGVPWTVGPIFGQNHHVLTTLSRAGKQSKLPHGYLLLPPPSRLRTAVAPLVAAGETTNPAVPASASRKTTRNRPRRAGQPRCRAVPPPKSPLPACLKGMLCPRSPDRTGEGRQPSRAAGGRTLAIHEKARQNKRNAKRITHRLINRVQDSLEAAFSQLASPHALVSSSLARHHARAILRPHVSPPASPRRCAFASARKKANHVIEILKGKETA